MTASEEIAELESDLEEEVEEARNNPEIPWRIEDDSMALWAGRKWLAAAQRIEEIDAEARRQIEQIKIWQATRKRADEETLAWFGSQLEGYALRERLEAEAEGRKARATIPLLGCSVKTQAHNPAIECTDEEALGLYLLTIKARDLVRISHKPLISEVRKVAKMIRRAVNAEGEVIEFDGSKNWPPEGFEEIETVIRLNGEDLTEGVAISERRVTAKVAVTKTQTTEGMQE